MDDFLFNIQELEDQLEFSEPLGFSEPPEILIDQEEVLDELRSKFTEAESYRSQYDEKATEWYKLYVGYQKKLEGRSNLHIPRTYEQIDTLRSRIVKAYAGQRPYAEFIPNTRPTTTMDDMKSNLKKANIASALVDQQLDKNSWKLKCYNYVTSFMVFPAGILGVGWKYEMQNVKRKHTFQEPVIDPFGYPVIEPMTGQPMMQERVEVVESEEVVFDDNELLNIDYYDFWPDPRGHDLDSCRYVFHREWSTRKQIEDKLNVLRIANNGAVMPLDWEEIGSGGASLEEGKWERLQAVGIAPETKSEAGTDESMDLYEVLNYWEDDRYAMLINRAQVVYDGANPYWRHNKKPFIASSYEPLPNEFYGMSAVQLIENLQHETNTIRNQRLDNVNMVINRMWKIRRHADIDESEIVSRPHGIIHVDSLDDVTDFRMQDVTQSAYQEETMAKQDMENALGTPAVVRGVDSARRETATEVVTKASNASTRFDMKIMLFEATGFRRLAMLMDLNNQQFIDGHRLIRQMGSDNPMEWQEVHPEDIVGEFDYRPSGAATDPAANKEIRREQLGQLLGYAQQSQSPFIDLYELEKAYLQSFDLRSIDKILKPKDQVEMEMQQQQQMMEQQMMQEQMMQQGNATGPPGPQPGPLGPQGPM